jgi:Ca2+:H+ antiporter
LTFSLKTHRESLGAEGGHSEAAGDPWPLHVAVATLGGVTLLIAFLSEIFVASLEAAAHSLGLTDAFVGFVVVALVGGAAEIASAISAARKDRLDLSIGIALGSAAQIALFVAPVLVLASYVVGPTPMTLQFWPGAVAMMMLATLTAAFVGNGGRSTWFTGVLVLAVYATFAIALYILPPRGP